MVTKQILTMELLKGFGMVTNILSKMLALIALVLSLTFLGKGYASENSVNGFKGAEGGQLRSLPKDDDYHPSKPYFVLIPGAGSNGGEIYIKNFSALLRLTGHGEYFAAYSEFLQQVKIRQMLCPRTKDLDSRLLQVRALECATAIGKNIIEGQLRNGRIGLPQIKKNIVLIGHSMGGNAARMVALNPAIKPFVHSVLTIATPHQGTPIADFVYEQYPNPHFRDDAERAFYHAVIEIIGFTPDDKRYLEELTTERRSNTPNIYLAQDAAKGEGIQYYSFINSMDRTLMVPLEVTNFYLKREMQERHLDQTSYGTRNDGIVPTYSMVHGKIIGDVVADHWETLCIGVLGITQGCRSTKKILFPFFQDLAAKIEKTND